MKKHKIAAIFSALCIVILCVSLFTACQKIERIEASQVERIVIWAQNTEEYELNAEDAARFIELYNASKYKGKGTGEGGTAEFGICVYFRDGTCLRANDFFGKLEVSIHNVDGKTRDWYYISSEELYTFVSELADSIKENKI